MTTMTRIIGASLLATLPFTVWADGAVLAVWEDFNTVTPQNGLTLDLNENTPAEDGSVTIGAAGLTITCDPALTKQSLTLLVDATIPESATSEQWLLGYGRRSNEAGMITIDPDGATFKMYNGTDYWENSNHSFSPSLNDGNRHTFALLYNAVNATDWPDGTSIYCDTGLVGCQDGLIWRENSQVTDVDKFAIGGYVDGNTPFEGLKMHKIAVVQNATSYQDAIDAFKYVRYTPIYELSSANVTFHNSTFVHFVTGEAPSIATTWHLFASGGTSFPATGATLRITEDIDNYKFDAQFTPLTFTGLIVEPGATGNAFASTSTGERKTEFGNEKAPAQSSYFTFHEDFTFERVGSVPTATCYGPCYFEIDAGKTLTISDATFVLSSGSELHLANGGTLELASLTIQDDVTLDIEGGEVTIAGDVAVSGVLHVLMTDVPAEEFQLLSTASVPTLTNVTATVNGVSRMVIAKADGLYLAPSWIEDYNPVAQKKLLAAGGNNIATVIGRHGNKDLTATEINASLELFGNIAKLATDGETVEVNYHFGVSSITVNPDKRIEATISVQTAEGEPAVIAQGATVELYVEDAEGIETVLASTVLTADAEMALLTTDQAYDEIVGSLLSEEASSKTLNLKVRAKKASVGAISSAYTLDPNNGTIVASGTPSKLYTMTLTSPVAANDVISFSIAGMGAYNGQDYTLEIGDTTYVGKLASGVVTFTVSETIAADTQVTLSVADAAGALEVLETGIAPVRIQKMLAKTPEEDLNPWYDKANDANRIFVPKREKYRDMYRIPGIATNGKGEVVAIYDLRYAEGDLGQTTTNETNLQYDAKTSVDIGESYSADYGRSWATFTNTATRVVDEVTESKDITSHVKIAIDVPNSYNFATIGGDTTIPTGKNEYSDDVDPDPRDGYGTQLEFADLDIGDPCIVYDPGNNRYLAMGITGGGLVSAGGYDGGANNGLALYSRPAAGSDGAGPDAQWTPLHTKTVTFPNGTTRTLSDNKAFEEIALTALRAAYLTATGAGLPSTKGFFQGPGHGMVTTKTVVDGQGNTIPVGTIVFPMQWFPQSGTIQACAIYSTDGGESWTSTSLTNYAGAHESCVVELDDGSWLMIAKHSNDGRAYMRTTDFLTWSAGKLKAPARYVQGSILKIGTNREGKSRYAMITATEGSDQYIRNNIKIFFATDDTQNGTNPQGIVWDDDSTAVTLFPGDSMQASYNSICLLGEGIIGVAYEARLNIYFERIDLRDKLNP